MISTIESMTDPIIDPSQPSSDETRSLRVFQYLSLALFAATIVLVLMVAACGRRDETTIPTGPSTTSPSASWPTFVAPFGGMSIPHPPELQPTVHNEFRVAFDEQPIPPDTDAPAPIEFSSYLHPVTEELAHIRSVFDSVDTDTSLTIGTTLVFHLVGRLKFDVFGWGGTSHGYFVFDRAGQTIVVDYNAEDHGTVAMATEMITRILSQP